MKKYKIQSVSENELEQISNRVLALLYTAPQGLLINTVMGLAYNIVEMTTRDTDQGTTAAATMAIIEEALKENESRPEYVPTILAQNMSAQEGEV